MASERFANSAQTALVSAIDNATTSLSVASAATFPGSGNFRIRIDNELLLVTGVSGTTWTATRGVESTTPAGHGSGAAVVQVLTAAAMNALAAVANLLHNGGFEVWQRGTSLSGLADDTYAADRWYVLTQTGSVACAQQAGTLGARYAAQLTQSQASAQRMGLAHIVEASDSVPYRSRTVQFQFAAKASTATTVRFALLEWTGTADAVTSDVVRDWTSGTYTANNFFLASNLTVTAVSSGGATTAYQTFAVSGTVSASCNNLIVFVWTESTAAQNVTLTLTECGVYDGGLAQSWLPRPVGAELALCQRYFWAWGVGSAKHWGLSVDGGNLYSLGCFTLPVEMRTTPTLVSSSWTAGAGNNGTVGYDDANPKGGRFYNPSVNWTAFVDMKLTVQLSAEL